jgi:hypothetical protein
MPASRGLLFAASRKVGGGVYTMRIASYNRSSLLLTRVGGVIFKNQTADRCRCLRCWGCGEWWSRNRRLCCGVVRKGDLGWG